MQRMDKGKHIEVVAAIICDGDRVFATQRGYGEWKDWWEFPGGKMEPGETPEAALCRESGRNWQRGYASANGSQRSNMITQSFI